MKKESIYCKEQITVRGMNFPRWSQCTRKATLNGYCRQHHPDTIKAREKAKDEKQEIAYQKRRIQHCAFAFKKALEEIIAGGKNPKLIAKKALEEI